MIRLFLTGLALAASTHLAVAQDSKPVEWVVGYAAGGGSDSVARATAEAMTKSLGRPIVILVVNAVNGNALLRQLFQIRVFHPTGHAPGRPDIKEGDLARNIRARQYSGLPQPWQVERRQGPIDQCRRHRAGIQSQAAKQGDGQQCKQDQRQK